MLPATLLFFAYILSTSLGDDITVPINSASNLILFSKAVNDGLYAGATVLLTADIDFTGHSSRFIPIGNSTSSYFLGSFDGQGHTISNLALNSSTTQYVGLFGYSVGATIQNVVIDDTCSFTSTYASSSYDSLVGSIIGRCYSSYNSCMIENYVNMANVAFGGNVTENLFIGGFIGFISSPGYPNYIRNCVNYGTVTHSGTSGKWTYLGGLVGYTHGGSPYAYIYNCLNYGTITHSGTSGTPAIGGIVGYCKYSFIENCVSSGVISTSQESDYTGAVMGYISGYTEITHCYWTSDVGCSHAYNFKDSEPIVLVVNSSLASLNQTIMNELNEYAAKNETWSKWLMVHLNGGSINNIMQESLVVIQGHFPDPVKEENTFLFWCKDAECNEVFDPKKDSVSEITDIYAGWTVNTVSFDFGNGTVVNVSFGYDTPVEYPKNITKEGYTFNGWDNYIEYMPAKNNIITALWTPNNYTVTFDFRNGTVVDVAFSYNTSIEYPKNLIKEGYVFNGWDSYIDFMPAKNITITALWTEKIMSKYVEIVFDIKELGSKDEEELKEEVKKIIKLYTNEEFTIEKFVRNSETGELSVIIKFVDEEDAVDFVRTVNENKRSNNLIKRISIISDDTNFSPLRTVFPLFFSLLFFM